MTILATVVADTVEVLQVRRFKGQHGETRYSILVRTRDSNGCPDGGYLEFNMQQRDIIVSALTSKEAQ